MSYDSPYAVARVIGAPVSSRNKDEEINPQRELRNDRFDALIRPLTASSIESPASRNRDRKEQKSLEQSYLTLDGSAARRCGWVVEERGRRGKGEKKRNGGSSSELPDPGRLGGAAGSSRSKAERIKEKERSHNGKGNKNAAERACLL